MKQAGLIIIVVGLLLTLFAGYNVVTKEKVVDIGKLEISHRKNNILNWSPLLGIAVMVVGGGVYVLGTRRS